VCEDDDDDDGEPNSFFMMKLLISSRAEPRAFCENINNNKLFV